MLLLHKVEVMWVNSFEVMPTCRQALEHDKNGAGVWFIPFDSYTMRVCKKRVKNVHFSWLGTIRAYRV